MSNNNLPFVSIITPFLNVENYLEECIESVLLQTYNNWELLLIDDGSSDGSSDIAKWYAFKYPNKIYYLDHENHINLGASASRNLGIEKSRGEYIAFLDADDVYLPQKLKVQVPLLNSNVEAGMVYASTEYWYSWTGEPEDAQKDWVWDHFGVQPNTLVKPPVLLTTFLRDGGTVPCMGSILVRRGAIEAVGGWENVFKYIYTDQVFHAKICLTWPVLVCSGCWDRYRQHQQSSTHQADKKNQGEMARYRYLVWLKKYIIKQKAHKNRDLWSAYKGAMEPYKYFYFKKVYTRFKQLAKKLKLKKKTFE